MLINDSMIRNTKPGPKPIRLSDGDGLYLLLSLGTYPEVSLKQARERRFEIRSQVANGGDPSAQRKAERKARGTHL